MKQWPRDKIICALRGASVDSSWRFQRASEKANDEKSSKMSFSIYIYGFAIALFIFYIGNLLLHLLGITYGWVDISENAAFNEKSYRFGSRQKFVLASASLSVSLSNVRSTIIRPKNTSMQRMRYESLFHYLSPIVCNAVLQGGFCLFSVEVLFSRLPPVQEMPATEQTLWRNIRMLFRRRLRD